MRPDIRKIGALVFRDGRLLIAKPKRNDFWLFVGGKIEGDETPQACLAREIQEELGVAMAGDPVFYMQSPIEPAAGDPAGRTVQIAAYFVELAGEPAPSSEIERLHWLSRADFETGRLPLGSVLRDHVIPRLIAEGRLT